MRLAVRVNPLPPMPTKGRLQIKPADLHGISNAGAMVSAEFMQPLKAKTLSSMRGDLEHAISESGITNWPARAQMPAAKISSINRNWPAGMGVLRVDAVRAGSLLRNSL